MKLYELLQSGIDVQSEWKVVVFNYDTYETEEIKPTDYEKYEDKDIAYLYTQDDILYIEIEPIG